jgi:hypothetical protein
MPLARTVRSNSQQTRRAIRKSFPHYLSTFPNRHLAAMASLSLQRQIRDAVAAGSASMKYAGRNNHGRYIQSGNRRTA